MKQADTPAKQVYNPLNDSDWRVAFLPGGFTVTV